MTVICCWLTAACPYELSESVICTPMTRRLTVVVGAAAAADVSVRASTTSQRGWDQIDFSSTQRRPRSRGTRPVNDNIDHLRSQRESVSHKSISTAVHQWGMRIHVFRTLSVYMVRRTKPRPWQTVAHTAVAAPDKRLGAKPLKWRLATLSWPRNMLVKNRRWIVRFFFWNFNRFCS